MCDLKNYDLYLTKLKRFARNNRIRVKFGIEPSDAWWSPGKRIVKIDQDLSESDTVSAFLHELGHSFDDTLSDKNSKSIRRAYLNYYKDRHTTLQWRIVLAREVEAWRYGAVIARMLGIPLGKWFFKYKSQCLGHYKS